MTRLPIHPLLFALLPVMSMYAVLPGTSLPDEIAAAALVATGTAAILAGAAWLVYRDLARAALAVSALVVVFTLHEEFDRIAGSWRIAGVRPFAPELTLLTAYLLVAASGIELYRWRRPIATLTVVANLCAVGALAVPAARVIQFQVSAALDDSPELAPVVAHKPVAAKPDIWYIVLDRYGSQRTLKRYGYDNEPFYRYLRAHGFYVAENSRANYIKTPLSLASSLNMAYLDDLAADEGRDSDDWLPVFERLEDHRVGSFLRSQGYDYVHAGSYWWPTRTNDNATQNINYYVAAPNALVRLLRQSILEPIGRAPSPFVNVRLQQWERVQLKMDELSRVARQRHDRPRFVFAHFLVPHGPYVFDADGSYLEDEEEWQRRYRTNYVNQVIAINRLMQQLIDRILKGSPTDPVIVVQADEGPYPEGTNASEYNWVNASPALLRERSGILNAYHLPGDGETELYNSITPVNTFRVIFNRYFGSRLPLLPDRVYRHESELRPYSFLDITHLVYGDGAGAPVERARRY